MIREVKREAEAVNVTVPVTRMGDSINNAKLQGVTESLENGTISVNVSYRLENRTVLPWRVNRTESQSELDRHEASENPSPHPQQPQHSHVTETVVSVTHYTHHKQTTSSRVPAQRAGQSVSHFYISIHDCAEDNTIKFRGTKGRIQGFINKHNFTGEFTVCCFQVTVPKFRHLRAYFEVLRADTGPSKTRLTLKVYDSLDFSSRPTFSFLSSAQSSPLLFSSKNVLFIKCYTSNTVNNTEMIPEVWLHFESTTENLRKSFNVVHHSNSSGYITLHGFDQNLLSIRGSTISYKLQLPPTHVLMLSFPVFKLSRLIHAVNKKCTSDFLELSSVSKEGQKKVIWKKCDTVDIEAITQSTSMAFIFKSARTGLAVPGFKAVFSFHPSTEAPQKVSSGLFNCSRHFETFRYHLDCNLRVECLHQEDEAGTCPFSNSHCKGQIYLKVSLHWNDIM